MLVIGAVWGADPPRLEESAAIERASKEPDGDRVVVGHISRTLGISVETLRAQRVETGLGWGDLLIAHRISRETRLPLGQVVAEWRGGKCWSDVARDHKVDLARLVSEVERSRAAIAQRAEDRAPRVDVRDGADESSPAGRHGAGTGRPRR